MGQEKKSITDTVQIQKVIQKVFMKLPVRARGEDDIVNVKILSEGPGLLHVKAIGGKDKKRVLFTSQNDHFLVLECELLQTTEQGGEVLKPLVLHIRPPQRVDKRVKLPGEESSRPTIRNCIAMAEFAESLGAIDKRRDSLLKVFESELSKKYDRTVVYLAKSQRLDYRMRALRKYDKVIFAPNIQNLDGYDHDLNIPTAEFEKIVSYDTLPSGIISEITVPFSFRNVFRWGYVSVFSATPFTKEDFQDVQQFAQDLEQEFENNQFLPVHSMVGIVMDVSSQGLGFMYPNNALMSRHMMPGADVVFDLYFTPEEERLSMEAEIQNTRIIGQTYRIGLSFKKASAEQEEKLGKYLGSL